uniref:Reticulon n=1 Tax=Bubo bubo TaxID=30461 RepID=A0A8C0FS72_BUBBB
CGLCVSFWCEKREFGLLFWRDVRKTGLVFGASLLLLLSLATLSAVSVVAHLALALLSVTISLRVYKAVVQAVQKSEEGHPFRTGNFGAHHQAEAASPVERCAA